MPKKGFTQHHKSCVGFTRHHKSGAGFTLIELLISISIIAILSAIGLIVYTSVLKQGRDSKRQSDLRLIQSGLEQYYHDQGYYPLKDTTCTNGKLKIGCALKDSTGNKTYINTIPSDPTGSPEYDYVPLTLACDNSTTMCTTYCLYAFLQNSNPGLGSCTDVTYNFALTPP